MIVRYLNVSGTIWSPSEADTILTVNSNRVLPHSVPFQGFQSISGRLHKVSQFDGVFNHEQLSLGRTYEIGRKAPWPFSRRNGLANLALE
jgi:hypothetical protein